VASTPKEDRVTTARAGLEGWSLDRLVGQLFSLAVGHHSPGGIRAYGDTAQRDEVEAVADIVRRRHIGGVCYFPSSAQGDSPERIRETVTRLQAAAGPVPLLISTDQENGTVNRLRQGATVFPSAMAVAALDDPGAAEELAYLSGLELRSVGITHTFAPVADVNSEPRNPVIGVRSPGSNPRRVAAHVSAVVTGLARAGVASTLKHFPGHGSTVVDSHLGLPLLRCGREEWESGEAIPFCAGLRAGADSVMIGHLVVPALDPSGVPATYSRPIVTGLLRDVLGFDGLAVTDALDMAGARLAEGPGEACVAALAAGVDQILMTPDPEGCIEAVIRAVEEGRLNRDQLLASARRVLTLKARLGLGRSWMDPDLPYGTPGHHDRAASAAVGSMTWRDPARPWRLPPPPARIEVIGHERDPGLRGAPVRDILATVIAEAGYEVTRTEIDADAGQAGAPPADAARVATPSADAIVVVTRDGWRDPAQRAMLERLEGLGPDGPEVCVVAARSPYDAALADERLPMLLMFGDTGPGARAAASVLLGEREADGHLPVDLVDRTGRVRWPLALEPVTRGEVL